MNALIKVFLVIYIADKCSSAHIPAKNTNEIITKFNIDPWDPDKYGFEYATSLGSIRKENGFFKTNENGEKNLNIKGFYSYIGSDSKRYRVDYFADETGYHPTISLESHDINDLLDSIQAVKPSDPKILKTNDFDLSNRVLPPGVIASLLG